jgi:hypothetical protein
MLLRQPVTQARRQQQFFIRIVRTIALAHETLSNHPVSERHRKTTAPQEYFSDRLLVLLC